MAALRLRWLEDVAPDAVDLLEGARAELASSVGSALATPSWPAVIDITYLLRGSFETVPYAVEESAGQWSGRVSVALENWGYSDAAERRRLLKAVALDALFSIGYRNRCDVEALKAPRAALGELNIRGGSHKSAAHKAWIEQCRREDPEFDKLFTEDEDAWDNPETAKPAARNLMRSEWLWDITDDFTPFGNDEGWDMMDGLCEWLDEHPRSDPVGFFREIVDSYPQPTSWNSLEEDEIRAIVNADNSAFLLRDNLVIAFAFGLLVRKGKVSPIIRDHALGAVKRKRLAPLGDDRWPEERVEEMAAILAAMPLATR